MSDYKKTAWFGSGHPAEQKACPRCGSGIGLRCVNQAFGVGQLGEITGMHAERVRLALAMEVR